jgi:hypothetical protein
MPTVTAMTPQVPASVADTDELEADAARRMYEAEVALHIARQTGVDAWIGAAYDRLHEAIAAHTAAVTRIAHPVSRAA